MLGKLTHYGILALFSGAFFFGIFHAVAEAQMPLPLPPIRSLVQSSPTPSTSSTSNVAAAGPTATPTTPIPTNTPTQTPAPTATPTPIPTAVPTIPTTADLEALFGKYSDEYHASRELMKKIARCESNFNPQADTGTYAGMFQFAAQTWISTRSAMGLDTNPDLRKNAEESIRTAAFMLGKGQENAWRNCL